MKEPKKICISRLDRIGDLIMTTPAIISIRQNWPKSKITLLASEVNSKVLNYSPLIDEIIEIDSKKKLIDRIKILFKIRNSSYDLFINFSPTTISYFFCFFSKASIKTTLIFLSRYKKSFSKLPQRILAIVFCKYIIIVNRNKLIKNSSTIHQTKMMLNLVEDISRTKVKDPDLRIPSGSKIEEKIKIFASKKIITIHLSKRWLNSYYSLNKLDELINKIKQKNVYIFLTTEHNNDSIFKDIIDKYTILTAKDLANNNFLNKNIINSKVIVLDKLEYTDWISIIKNSNQVITPESGCTHVAAAFKVPVIVIYNADNMPNYIYNEYGPWKSPHKKLTFSSNDNINDSIYNFLNQSIIN